MPLNQKVKMKADNSYQNISTKPQISSSLLIVITINMFLYINQLYIVGVIFTLFSFFVLFRTSGYILDKENSRIKMISGYSGFKMGKWYKLPEVKYVSLLRINQPSNSNSGSIISNTSPKSFAYQVNLVVRIHREHRPIKLMTTNEQSAREEGKKLGAFLDLKVFDSTSHKRCWLNNSNPQIKTA